MTGERRKRAGLFASLLALAGLSCLVSWLLERGAFRPELAKALIQLAVVVVVGAIANEAFAQFAAKRESERRLNDRRLEMLRDLTESYNGIKAVRRALRGLGFDPRSAPGSKLDSVQAGELQKQMVRLIDAQLSFERAAREVRWHLTLFPGAKNPEEPIQTVEEYVNLVIEEWEEEGFQFVAGAGSTLPPSMKNLRAFLDHASMGFDHGASGPMAEIEQRIGSYTWRAR